MIFRGLRQVQVKPRGPRVCIRQFGANLAQFSKHDGSYNQRGSTVDTEEVLSENNPWSPTLYSDIVHVRDHGSWRSRALPANYRLSYLALYEAPGSKYVAMLKRLTLSFGVLGCYGAKLFYESPQFDDIYAVLTLASCALPAVFVQYKTRHYVTRIFRLYDKQKPQTLKNLLQDEKLIVEKLNVTGGKTYNQLLTLSGNQNLKLLPPPNLKVLAPYSSWVEEESSQLEGSGARRQFYVVDNIGGLKMDRLWGIVEHNSNVDTGRYIEPEAVQILRENSHHP